jgi:hypothetical protein
MRLSSYSLLIVVVSALMLAACTANDTKPTTQAKKAKFVPSTVSADGIARITIPELEVLLKDNEAVVIDVRNQESFDEEHILGSKLIPELEIVARANELPSDKLIVTYCS